MSYEKEKSYDEKVKEGGKLLIEAISGVINDSKKTFLCKSCAHKAVCSKIEEPGKECEYFSDATLPQRYSSINHFFQPIFDWIKFHYPAGEVKFIVDYNSAKMFIEHGPFVVSNELNGNTDFGKLYDKTEEDSNG